MNDDWLMNDDWIMNGDWPTSEQWEPLMREWRDDAVQRLLREKGVRYEDEYNRVLDEAIERGKFRQQALDKNHER